MIENGSMFRAKKKKKKKKKRRKGARPELYSEGWTAIVVVMLGCWFLFTGQKKKKKKKKTRRTGARQE